MASRSVATVPSNARPGARRARPRAERVDRIENELRERVCSGELTLAEAQRRTTAAAGMTEAPGKQPALSADLAGGLRAGKTVVRDIDWVAAKAEVSAAGAQGFKEAMTKLGRALKEGGGKFRLDLYLDQRYDESSAKMVGEQRFPVIQAALIEGSGDPSLTVQTGKVARDADPRLEISRIK